MVRPTRVGRRQQLTLHRNRTKMHPPTILKIQGMNVTECPGMAKIYKPHQTNRKNDNFHVYILYRSHSSGRWNLSLTCKSQQQHLDTHGHDRVDLKNFDFSYEQLRKEICTTIFTNRIMLFLLGKSIKRSINKSKPLIIHFTYLYYDN
jgi:hypothetical protein